LKNTKAVLEKLGLKRSGKVSHTARLAGARQGFMSGAAFSGMQICGNSALNNSYLQTVPHEFLKVMAGFDVDQKSIYIGRAEKIPPEALVHLVFSGLRQMINSYEEGEYDDDNEVEDADDDDDSLTLKQFLKYMKYLAIVFLQDSDLLKREFPGHFLWKDPSSVFVGVRAEIKGRYLEQRWAL
jgi:hypothetical protein